MPLWYAAALLVCFSVGFVISNAVSRSKPIQQAISATSTTIRVPLGSKSNVTLPDGSSVWVNAGSEISYPSDFGIEKREIQLTGEAYFNVQSDSLMPFNVHTPGMTVRALGTRFNVKAYPEDNIMTATLEEGIVDVIIKASSKGKISEQSVILKPKEQLVIQKVNAPKPVMEQLHEDPTLTIDSERSVKEVIIKPNVKTELSTSWKDSKWIVSSEPLALFASNLERRYNVNIRFASEDLKEYNFSGTFEDETVEQILNALSLAAPVNYRLIKNNVVLSLNKKDKDKFDKILKNKM